MHVKITVLRVQRIGIKKKIKVQLEQGLSPAFTVPKKAGLKALPFLF
jgi:hypothetical protein